MAKIVSIIQYVGRAGSTVGSKGKKGSILLRQYQPSVANPRTDAQMQQRAKFKLASQVAGMLGHVGRTALVADGYRKTDRGQLTKMLQKMIVWGAARNRATLPYALHLVDNPSYAEDITLVVTSDANAYTATFSGAASGEVIAKAILVHDITRGSWRHTSSMDTRTAISIGKAVDEVGDALEIFAYGIVLEPKTTDGFNNVGQTGADQTGYLLDVNKVNTLNYDFSPTICAALTIANGQAATGGGSGSGNTGQGGNSGSGSTGGNTGGGGGGNDVGDPDTE